LVRTIVKAMGMSTPPANPCRPRIAIIDGRSRANAQAMEKRANRMVLPMM